VQLLVQEDNVDRHDGKQEEGSSLVLLVELWRSDLVTSVVELDSEGNVMHTIEQQALAELYPPGGMTNRGATGCCKHCLLPPTLICTI
jgi:hypothetical protein